MIAGRRSKAGVDLSHRRFSEENLASPARAIGTPSRNRRRFGTIWRATLGPGVRMPARLKRICSAITTSSFFQADLRIERNKPIASGSAELFPADAANVNGPRISLHGLPTCEKGSASSNRDFEASRSRSRLNNNPITTQKSPRESFNGVFVRGLFGRGGIAGRMT